jgi:hypothetical protein
LKTQRIAVHFYLGHQKQAWFGLTRSQNAFVFCICKWLVTTHP